MAITTYDQLIAAPRQYINIMRPTTKTVVALGWWTMFDAVNGYPSGGTLAGTDAVSGVVPTCNTPGYPAIDTFGPGATGYLSSIEFASSVACRFRLYDDVFKVGAFPYNADVTLANQPSYVARMPGGKFTGTQIWIEGVVLFSATSIITVRYVNQDGVAGRTATIQFSNPIAVGRRYLIPLQAGDSGVQMIERVTMTGSATSGSFNIIVARPLWSGRVSAINSGDLHDQARCGMPIVFQDSALNYLVNTDAGTTSGMHEFDLIISNG